MIIKPSVQFLNSDNDATLIVDVGNILTALTGNPGFQPPPVLPTLADCGTALTDFKTAVTNAADGGVTLTAIKNAKRAALVVLMRQLANYVQAQCGGDLAVLMSSGFPIQKPQRQPVGILPAPAGLKVSLGLQSGTLNVAVTPLKGAGSYNWRVTTAAQPNVVVQMAQTTAASNIINGLTAGVVYNIEASAVGAVGVSDWSEPVPQMVV